MQTCNTASDPEAWLLISPKLESTRIFHLIYFMCMCMCVCVCIFFPLCWGFSTECLLRRIKRSNCEGLSLPLGFSHGIAHIFVSLSLAFSSVCVFTCWTPTNTSYQITIQAFKNTQALSHTHTTAPWAPRWPTTAWKWKCSEALWDTEENKLFHPKDRLPQWDMTCIGLCLLI